MNNILSYCGLVDLRINASDNDLPVQIWCVNLNTPLELISTHCGSNNSKELLNFELANDNYFVFGLRNALYILLNLIAF